MLEIKNLTFNYPHHKQPVIDDITLSISSGKVYGLLGPNGAGKSTLLYLIAGLLTPTKGDVEYNEVKTSWREPQTLADIFIVPEEFELPKMKLTEYVKLCSQFYPHFSMSDMESHLSTFGLSKDINLTELSMGQKKKAYMCFALATNTPLMLMDEPTNGLDIPGKASFRSFIASCMNDERTIIISTHQVYDIAQLLDNVLIMEQNKILLDRSVSEITSKLAFKLSNDQQEIARALYAQPTFNGVSIVLPNLAGEETELNLETLFQLVTTKPSETYRIFNS